MSKCQNCGVDRVLSISSKCEDNCTIEVLKSGYDKGGPVPDDLGIGGGDYVEFEFCLDCGQIQGDWPLQESEIEADALADDEEDPKYTDDDEEDMDGEDYED